MPKKNLNPPHALATKEDIKDITSTSAVKSDVASSKIKLVDSVSDSPNTPNNAAKAPVVAGADSQVAVDAPKPKRAAKKPAIIAVKKAVVEKKPVDAADSDYDEDGISPSFDSTEDLFGHIRFEVRIPRARLPMLIGSKGDTKKRIESETGCKLSIDSQEGDVTVEGADVVKGYVVRDIVKAIGRGFNPDIALELLKADVTFELVEMTEFVKNKNAMERLKGRVIGQGGKTRETIEKLMDVHVSVQGKTIGIIGEIERVTTARQAVEMLLEGSQHAHVYRWLEDKRRAFTRTELSGGPDYGIKEEYKKYLKD